MYLTTLSKHPLVYYNQLMIIIYKIHCLIKSRSMTCASLFGSTMFDLIDVMTRHNLDINIIAHDRNLTIIISSFLHALLYVMEFIN